MKKLLTILAAVSLFGLAVFGAVEGTITTNTNTDMGTREGAEYAIAFSGDFDSGTVSVQYLIGDTYVSYEDMDAVADDFGKQFKAMSAELRIVTASIASAADIDYKLMRLDN